MAPFHNRRVPGAGCGTAGCSRTSAHSLQLCFGRRLVMRRHRAVRRSRRMNRSLGRTTAQSCAMSIGLACRGACPRGQHSSGHWVQSPVPQQTRVLCWPRWPAWLSSGGRCSRDGGKPSSKRELSEALAGTLMSEWTGASPMWLWPARARSSPGHWAKRSSVHANCLQDSILCRPVVQVMMCGTLRYCSFLYCAVYVPVLRCIP